MKLFKLLAVSFWLLTACQLSGCVTIVNMETVRPPAVRVSPSQWKVLVVNRLDKSRTSNKNDRVNAVLDSGAYQAAGGVMGAIYEDSTFMLLNPDRAIMLPSPTDAQLSQAEVRDLYTRYRPHLILALDKFDAQIGKEVDSYEDEDGFQSKTANFDLIVSSRWSLYDSTGQVIDQATTQQKEFYDSRAVISGLLTIGPAMAKAGPDINRLAIETGYNYWDRFYPQPMLLVREVHLSSKLNETVFMLTTGQFQKAIDTLLPMAHDSTAKQHRKAVHNLAVAYEAVGDYERAVYWARQAEAKGDKLSANLLALWENAGLLK